MLALTSPAWFCSRSAGRRTCARPSDAAWSWPLPGQGGGKAILGPQLDRLRETVTEVEARARELGLDWGEVEFELVSPQALAALSAYGLFPRFSHWSFGRAYRRLRARQRHGERFFELVLPTQPVKAYLVVGSPVQTKLAVAHALAHADFLHHNRHFRAVPAITPKKLAQHAMLLRGYERRYGLQSVEAVLDAALALQSYAQLEDGDDLLALVARSAPDLSEWQREVVALVRTESLCLRAVELTRLTNEGWATYWHTRIMRALPLKPNEIPSWALLQAELLRPRPPAINPYLVGFKVFQTLAQKEPRERLFRIREEENDASLVERYLTAELVKELDLFVFRALGGRWVVTAPAEEAEAVRQALVRQLGQAGVPALEVVDADYRGRKELYLRHRYDGRPLAEPSLALTLAHLYSLWGRPVHLETATEARLLVYTADRSGVRISSARPQPPGGSFRCCRAGRKSGPGVELPSMNLCLAGVTKENARFGSVKRSHHQTL